MCMQSASETMARDTPPTNDTPGTMPRQRAAAPESPLSGKVYSKATDAWAE